MFLVLDLCNCFDHFPLSPAHGFESIQNVSCCICTDCSLKVCIAIFVFVPSLRPTFLVLAGDRLSKVQTCDACCLTLSDPRPV